MRATEPPAAIGEANHEIALYLDPGEASPATIAEVLIALSELHRALGGAGLEFEAEGTLMRVR